MGRDGGRRQRELGRPGPVRWMQRLGGGTERARALAARPNGRRQSGQRRPRRARSASARERLRPPKTEAAARAPGAHRGSRVAMGVRALAVDQGRPSAGGRSARARAAAPPRPRRAIGARRAMLARHASTLQALILLAAAFPARGGTPSPHDGAGATWLAAHAMPLAPGEDGEWHEVARGARIGCRGGHNAHSPSFTFPSHPPPVCLVAPRRRMVRHRRR